MLADLPKSVDEVKGWGWAEFEPLMRRLEAVELDERNVTDWLADWSRVTELIMAHLTWTRLAADRNTADSAAEGAYHQLSENLMPPASQADHDLSQKLLASGLVPAGMELAIKNKRTDAALFRPENLALSVEEQKLDSRYAKITGAQTVQWQGQELTLQALAAFQQSPDRAVREETWRLGMNRRLQDRAALNELWQEFLALRLKIAANAGFDNYRDYIWQEKHRFDYTPADCESFHRAIEEAVVPAARRVIERRRERLGLASLRPWDGEAPVGQPLPPIEPTVLEERAGAIFQQVDPQLAQYFATMRQEKLLDLFNRPNKRGGGFNTSVMVDDKIRPYIFMNAVGLRSDITTILHECGHAFHTFEFANLPYIWQMYVGHEFAEVASMSMELLASPYLAQEQGGYYSPVEAARARRDHLEGIILFWPYMAVVDAFQHWVYTHPQQAADPSQCDAEWGRLWTRFMPFEDWSGLEEERVTGWHRKLHIFLAPFYYVEYGLAQLGAVQIWGNALQNRPKAIADYRAALRLGATVGLPELFRAAGAKLAWDTASLSEAVGLIEHTLEELDESVKA